jgi:hypothetical protein
MAVAQLVQLIQSLYQVEKHIDFRSNIQCSAGCPLFERLHELLAAFDGAFGDNCTQAGGMSRQLCCARCRTAD